MWKADALQVIGQTLRPVAMARDENQLPPTVMTLMDKDGSMLNQFAPDTRTSMLEHLKRTGQPPPAFAPTVKPRKESLGKSLPVSIITSR
ncbi:hypothetical protein FALCPG4_003255 [Fusarium falciforme]